MESATGQKEFWEMKKKRRSPDHPVIDAFVAPKIDYIRSHIDINKTTSILDVGCGNGFFLYSFSKISNPVGLDFSHQMLSMNPCKKIVQGSALFLPFKDKSFDVVFCSNLLHHIEDPQEAIADMKRVSKRYVILSEPNRNNPLMALFSAKVAEERGALKFSLKYMRGLIEACGLNIVDSCSMGSIVPNKTPLKLLAFFKRIDRESSLGFYNLIISKRQN